MYILPSTGHRTSSGLAHSPDAIDLRRAFAAEGCSVEIVHPEAPEIANKSFEIILPTIGVLHQALSDGTLQIALNVISSFIHDRLKGVRPTEDVSVTLSIVQKRSDGSCGSLEYTGPYTEAVEDAIRKAAEETFGSS